MVGIYAFLDPKNEKNMSIQMTTSQTLRRVLHASVLMILATGFAAGGADQPTWGEPFSRNLVSSEQGLIDRCDPATGQNIRWSIEIGTSSYASPVVARGRVFIGTNNGVPKDPAHAGDRGVMLCLDEKNGRLVWQLVAPKREKDMFLDWPNTGITGAVTVEGDRVYMMSNRGEILCLDLQGLANGNDGPFTDEAAHLTPAGSAVEPLNATDADILWVFNPAQEAGVWNHDSAHACATLCGPYLYINSCNGVDNTHKLVRAPEAPSLLVLDKKTGRLVGRDQENMGPRIIHNTWSVPSLGEVGGRSMIFFGGGDAVCYAFETLSADAASTGTRFLKNLWRYDCDPEAPKEDIMRYQDNRKEGPSLISGMPVYHDGRVYVIASGDYWHGKPVSWLRCIDASGSGDITKSGAVWSFRMENICMGTPAVKDGLVYLTDCARNVHCLDARDGRVIWTHKTGGEFWGSALVADGKVYAGNRRGELVILAAGREKKVLSTANLGDPISCTPCAANGVVYVSTMTHLYALASGK